MKATVKAMIAWAAPCAGLLLAASAASAQYVSPVMKTPLGYAPDTYSPGFYVMCPDGTTLGPNYYLRPCFQPYQGVRPMVIPIRNGDGWDFRVQGGPQQAQQQQQQQRSDAFPYHPYVRGPRDFFMFRENVEEQARATRPLLVP
jgi:hypothetical protein